MFMIYLVKYWKQIALVVLALILVSFTIYVSKVISDRNTARLKVVELENNLKLEKENTAQYKKAVDLKAKELKEYVALQKVINDKNNAIEIKYENLLSRYNSTIKNTKVVQIATKPTTVVTNKDGVETREVKCFLNSIEQNITIFPKIEANTDLSIGKENK